MAAGAEGDSNLPMSHVGREQVLDALKVAFVHGRLAKDEFDLRVGQVLAACADDVSGRRSPSFIHPRASRQ